MKQINLFKYFSKIAEKTQKIVSSYEIGGNVFIYFLKNESYNFITDLQEPVIMHECELIDTSYQHQFLLQTKPQVKIVL